MISRPLVIHSLIIWALSFSINISAEVRLGTALMPPYQKETPVGIKGSAVDTILCVLEEISEESNIELFPSSRLIYSLKHLETDAIFSLGDRNPNIGVPSSPIVLEKWYWFYNEVNLKINPENKDVRVAVVRGSEAEYWLRKQGYNNVFTVNIIEQALKMLNTGRINVVLADNLQVQEASRTMGLMVPSEFSLFQKFTSLRVHFSPSYLDKNPDLLPAFNNNIQYCNPAGSYLTLADKSALLAIADSIREWVNTEDIKQLLIDSTSTSKNLTQTRIQELDKQWREHRGSHLEYSNSLISEVFNSHLSEKVRGFKREYSGLFSEIIITDKQGLNIAISDIPSDYWQGDEEKYLKTILTNNLSTFIDRIRFDSSSSTFQSQINFAVTNKNSDIIGMVIVGVNVELALKNRVLQ